MTDPSDGGPPLSERLRDLRLIEQALARAVREALQRHRNIAAIIGLGSEAYGHRRIHHDRG
jgi:hypothetical protein